MSKQNDIISFIKGFSPVKDFFLNGYCYWFAVILSLRFEGQIWYLPIENHFVCKIGRSFYDASGKLKLKSEAMLWESYPDEIQKERIIKFCINKADN